ncbi:hypothetical protein GCM10011309_25500 [Litorimonas cladophorae]|uniref:Uncharacterized protein n=2 Tax=Litorimonas cladophorae TaxID=1220491 RepID=A0A918NHX5_9PROT|nr:hypothetical protein GCM10011309_25500 [Litorimonas cladophorae]
MPTVESIRDTSDHRKNGSSGKNSFSPRIVSMGAGNVRKNQDQNKRELFIRFEKRQNVTKFANMIRKTMPANVLIPFALLA